MFSRFNRPGRRMVASRMAPRRRAQNSSVAQVVTAPDVTAVPPPTFDQLRILAIRSAIPMVGFGMVDNIGTSCIACRLVLNLSQLLTWCAFFPFSHDNSRGSD